MKAKQGNIGLHSFAIAFMIVTQFLGLFARVYFGLEAGFIPFAAIFALFLCVVDMLFFGGTIRISGNFVLNFLVVGLCVVITLIQNGTHTSMDLKEMFFYTILTVYIIEQSHDSEKVFRWVMVLSLPALLMGGYYSAYIDMGSSYATLPCVLGGLIHFVFYRKEMKGRMWKAVSWLCYLNTGINMIRLFTHATRGASLAVIVGIIIILFYREKRKKGFAGRYFRMVLLAATALLIMANVNNVIETVYYYCQEHNIQNEAINKSFRQMRKGDLNNGRDALYQEGWRGFSEAPIFGKGIGVFRYNSVKRKSEYPHFFILQFLHDSGLVLGGILIYRSFRRTWSVFSGGVVDTNKLSLMLLCICSGVVQSCFSGDVWKSITFWLLMGMDVPSEITSRRGGVPLRGTYYGHRPLIEAHEEEVMEE